MSIYPKLAAARATAVAGGTCFLLMPFIREMRSVHAAVKEICENLGIKCTRADDIYSQRPIFASILDSIISSEIIISDLTGKNPNVFYETGIAHSVREPQSVILVAQSLDDVPFDLRHLPIVLYRMENLEKFEVELESRIIHSRTATRGVNFATNYLFPLNFQAHDIKSFIDYANELSRNFFSLIAKCLDSENKYSTERLDNREIDEIFRTLQLVSEANNGRWKRICDYLKLEVLCIEQYFDLMRDRCLAHLQKTTVNQLDITDRDEDFFSAELCFKLIERDIAKRSAINWLLAYLHNPRMANIDVVRYKIESFIVDCNDIDLDASLLALLAAEPPSVRENAADMIGHKSIMGAGQYLKNALETEENPYAARSMIAALARQNAVEAVPVIIEWVRGHLGKWQDVPVSTNIKRISERAIEKLAPNSEVQSEFHSLYSSGNSSNKE